MLHSVEEALAVGRATVARHFVPRILLNLEAVVKRQLLAGAYVAPCVEHDVALTVIVHVLQ